MIPLNRIRAGDPLNELVKILLSFIDDGLVKRMAVRGFEDNKPRVKAIIRQHRSHLIELIEAI